ncbi:MAG: NUDIX hydrolase [Candidatus Omnitrophota bacterium]
MELYKYCPMCKTSLEEDHVEGRDRLICKKCRWINYLNPVPVVACIVFNDKKELLLIKRAIDPCKGKWALPGGFIELDENLEDAGCRELYEETSLKSEPGRLIGVYLQDSKLYGNVIVVGMEFIAEEHTPASGDDAMDARFFSLEDLPEIPFFSHQNLIRDIMSK